MKVILLILLFLVSVTLKGQGSLIIEGNIDKSLDGQTVSLAVYYPHPTTLIPPEKITSVIKEGKFFFTVSATGVENYFLSLYNKSHKYSKGFYLAPKYTVINFLDTLLKDYVVIGNDIHSEHLKRLNEQRLSGKDYTRFTISWIKNHITSALAVPSLFDVYGSISEEELTHLFSLMPEGNKLNSWGQEIRYLIENLQIGKQAPVFSQNDRQGKEFALLSFRGKYVLIDFWASWCIPCKQENPYLIKAMEDFKCKGFEILSVSLDDDKNSWIESIKKDSLNWTHVSDLKGWKNEVSRTYRIKSIPQNLLLDPEGKIVAKNLRGKEIHKVLSSFLYQ